MASRLGPDDVLFAAAASREALFPAVKDNWSVRAGDLEWSCHRTLDHIASALLGYARNLASRATERLPTVRSEDPDQPPFELLTVMESLAAVLAEVARAVPPDTRAYHSAGMADVSGFIAMGCDETLIHTADIAQGLHRPFHPPDDLCARVAVRLFPWAPSGFSGWETLRWANGRAALPGHDRLGPDWSWHCAPLEEWEGTVKKSQMWMGR